MYDIIGPVYCVSGDDGLPIVIEDDWEVIEWWVHYVPLGLEFQIIAKDPIWLFGDATSFVALLVHQSDRRFPPDQSVVNRLGVKAIQLFIRRNPQLVHNHNGWPDHDDNDDKPF